jgi:C_GCAxxG_C_C family probable redox protein
MKIKRKITRRKFVKISALAATAAGVSALAINYGLQSSLAKAKTSNLKMAPKDTKEVFMKCGTCSQTFFYLLNREFGHLKENEERASGPLAGGLMLGHQCGMLWGSALAAGAESFRRNNDRGHAIASAITATQQLMTSFTERTKSVNCRDVSPADFTKKLGMAKLVVQIILHGGLKNTPCFNLAEDWAPEAIQSATAGLSFKQNYISQSTVSCASEVVRKMGGNDEEIVGVSGFAGGLGLKGHACGALAAAIWMNTLTWCKKHPGETPPFFKPDASNVIKTFYGETNSEILCQKISGKSFQTLNEHTEFIQNGGCDKLINTLSISAST